MIHADGSVMHPIKQAFFKLGQALCYRSFFHKTVSASGCPTIGAGSPCCNREST